MTERITVKQIIKSYLLVILAPVGLLAPVLFRGQALFWGTPSLQFVPWWWQAWQGLRQGALPLWNPNSGLGAPLAANYQAAFFYPPNWLLFGFAGLGGPPAIAWGYTLLALAHLIWAGLGMALLLRGLSFRWLGQVIGGLAFGLSGYIVARLGFFSMVWVAAWLPWVIYFADQIASPRHRLVGESENRFFVSIKLVGCLTMQLLAGHAQLAWYSLLLAGMWITAGALRAGGIRHILRAMASLAAAAVMAAGLASVQLIPTFEYLQLSPRADEFSYENAIVYSFWPWRFITLLSPDFFGSPALGDYWGYASYWEDHLYAGLLPLLLALATFIILLRGLWLRRRDGRWPLLIFLWILLPVSFILALGNNTPVFPFLYRWAPTFDMFQAPARYLVWAAFAIPLLAAVGTEHWRCPTGRGLYWFRLVTAGAFAVTLGAGLAWIFMRDINLTFIRATALTGMWGLGIGLLTLVIPLAQRHNKIRLWEYGVLIWLLADLLVTGWGLNPGVRLSFYGEQTQKLPTAETGQRIYLSSTEEYALKFRRFLRFTDFRPLEDWRAMRAALIPNLNLLDGVASTSNFDPLVTGRYARWMMELDTLQPEARKGWLALMNVGLIEHIDGRTESGVRFDPVPGAQRWRWYSCAQPAENSEDAWSVIQTELQASPRADRAVILETADEPGAGCFDDSLAVVELIEDRPDRVALRADVSGAGWLVLADSWYPGWVAKVNGRPAAVYPADTLFRAVYLAPGAHDIEFLYHPTGFYFAALFSILVLLLMIVVYRVQIVDRLCRRLFVKKSDDNTGEILWKRS